MGFLAYYILYKEKKDMNNQILVNNRNLKQTILLLTLIVAIFVLGVILTGCFKSDPITVTYDANGGSFDDGNLIQERVYDEWSDISNDSYSLSYEGYKFSGWAFDADGNKPFETNVTQDNIFTLYAVWVDEREDVEDFEYTYYSDSEGYFVSKWIGTKENVRVPSKYNAVPVVGIDHNTFKWNEDIQSVVIPDSITKIGDSVFYDCINLVEVVMPDSVVTVGMELFMNCTSLLNVRLSESLLILKDGMFGGCSSMSGITIPTSVTKIERNVFSECENLDSIIIPKNVTSIGKMAFFFCKKLRTVTMDNEVKEIGEMAFYECKSLKTINISNNLLKIESSTFYNCSNIARIDLPEVESIGSSAFEKCSNLVYIRMPKVRKIEEHAFYACASLENLTLPECMEEISDFAFYSCGFIEIIIPVRVNTIGTKAFGCCSFLEKITIPSSVNKIGKAVFTDCAMLEEIHYGGLKDSWDVLTFDTNWDIDIMCNYSIYCQDVIITVTNFSN